MRPAESATELRRGCDRVATGELQQRAGSCDGVVTVDDRGEKRGGEVLWCGGLVGYTAGMEASKESGSRRKGEGDLYEIFDRKCLRKDYRLDSKNEGEKGDSCRGVCLRIRWQLECSWILGSYATGDVWDSSQHS